MHSFSGPVGCSAPGCILGTDIHPDVQKELHQCMMASESSPEHACPAGTVTKGNVRSSLQEQMNQPVVTSPACYYQGCCAAFVPPIYVGSVIKKEPQSLKRGNGGG
jgi:hypothetical protein